jgi:hypothetical protein
MSKIPENPEVLLTEKQTSDALTELGFPIASATLATRRSRGGGPPFQKFGSRVLYRWRTTRLWGEAKLSRPLSSTSEVDFRRIV